jgi:hypothetical protein
MPRISLGRHTATRWRIAVILFAAACGLLTLRVGRAAAFRALADAAGRFTIEVPADWEVMSTADSTPAVVARDVEADVFHTNVNVVVMKRTKGSGPEEYADSGGGLRKILKGYTLIQEGPATVAGRPAYYRYYTWQMNEGPDVYQVQVYFTSASYAFVVTGTTKNDPDHVRRDLPLLARIIESFRVSRAGH